MTVSTNAAGQLTVTIPATGLAAPSITMSMSGGALETPVAVDPSGPVNAYLAGTTTLNTLPQLTADVLAQAPIGPVNTKNAAAAFEVISSAAKAGMPAGSLVGCKVNSSRCVPGHRSTAPSAR